MSKKIGELEQKLDALLTVIDKLPKEIIMPKFVEKIFPDYKLVPKNIEYEVHVPKRVEKPYDVAVPVLKEVPKEVIVEHIKIIKKEEIIPWPKAKHYDVEVLSKEEISRLREFADVLLPKLMDKLDTIVKWIPKEEPYLVKVPEIVKVPYEVKEPVFTKKNIAEPIFTKVNVISPVIVEKGMSLDDWEKEAKKNTEKIIDAAKSKEEFGRKK